MAPLLTQQIAPLPTHHMAPLPMHHMAPLHMQLPSAQHTGRLLPAQRTQIFYAWKHTCSSLFPPLKCTPSALGAQHFSKTGTRF